MAQTLASALPPPPASPPDAALLTKLHRLRAGGSPRTLDLFAGCGGLSLGFQRAGFDIVAAVEFDADASFSHARNFHGITARDSPLAAPWDITEKDCDEFARQRGLSANLELEIDVIVGGPPCQSFARVGRAKLREVAARPDAFLHDPRARLYIRFLEYIRRFKPLAVLMENVPDVINHGGRNIPREVCNALAALGYRSGYTLLNAVHYGVPQMRDRMFLVAYHEVLRAVPSFPAPSHSAELPRGYESTRSVALKHVTASLFDGDPYFVEPPAPHDGLPRAVTAEEALADLPPYDDHLRGLLRKGPARFDTLRRYRDVPPSPYAKAMREWPGYESGEGVYDHVIRWLPRDYAIFREMSPGDQYPEAYRVAEQLFARRLAELESQGRQPVPGSPEWERLRASIVPPYDVTKFPNKWRKMEADRPARTLMAHIGKDSYSHIHYDSGQARTISVREAARLQSFPDGFWLAGRMNSALRQIGNAVPPLLAAALAGAMREPLRP